MLMGREQFMPRQSETSRRLACVVTDYPHEIRKSGVRVPHSPPIVRKTAARTDSGLLFQPDLFPGSGLRHTDWLHARRVTE
jgi:hypothetical protein